MYVYLDDPQHLGNLLALLVVIIVVYIFHREQKSTTSPIDFVDLFLDPKTGKIGGSEFRINTAFMVTSWALIYFTLKGTLTEWYIAAYLTAFVADRVFSTKYTYTGMINGASNDGKTSTTTAAKSADDSTQ